MSNAWSYIIIEGYCAYDFKTKRTWGGKKIKPLKECKKYPTHHCLGTTHKCPAFLYCCADKKDERAAVKAIFKKK